MSVIVSERPFTDTVRRLRQFGDRSIEWRVPLCLLTWVVTRIAVPIGVAVLIAITALGGKVAAAVLAAMLTLVLDRLGAAVRARLPWKALAERRLWTYERPNPSTEVPVLVGDRDVERAKRVMRAAQLNPSDYFLMLSQPPEDARDLDRRIAVCEPAAWRRTQADTELVARVAAVLTAGGVTARVAGIDVPSRRRLGAPVS